MLPSLPGSTRLQRPETAIGTHQVAQSERLRRPTNSRGARCTRQVISCETVAADRELTPAEENKKCSRSVRGPAEPRGSGRLAAIVLVLDPPQSCTKVLHHTSCPAATTRHQLRPFCEVTPRHASGPSVQLRTFVDLSREVPTPSSSCTTQQQPASSRRGRARASWLAILGARGSRATTTHARRVGSGSRAPAIIHIAARRGGGLNCSLLALGEHAPLALRR